MTEHQISVTLKAGKDFDSPWVVVYGDDPFEVEHKLANIEGLLKQTVSTAAVLRSLHALEAGGLPATPTQPVQQAAPAQPAPSGWGQPQQQAAPAQQGGASHPNAQLHPEGNACDQCGKVLEFKKTQSGKAKWQCPDWRWNNGNPNGHGMEWAN